MKKSFPGQFLGAVLIAALVLAAIGLSLNLSKLTPFLQGSFDWIRHQGFWAPFFFTLFYMSALLFLPIGLLTMSAGFVFGVLEGSICVSVGSFIVAMTGFFIGRYLAQDWVNRKIRGHRYLKAMEGAIRHAGWKLILLTRVSFLFPFNLLNLTYGISSLPASEYAIMTWLGMLPGIFVNVYLGTLVGNWVGLENRAHPLSEWFFFGLSLLASGIATLYLVRLTRQAAKAHSH